jgi:ABC-2 type transport system permease protein
MHVLPVRPLSNATVGAFFGAGISIADLAIVLGWGALGAVIAARFFRWQPNR